MIFKKKTKDIKSYNTQFDQIKKSLDVLKESVMIYYNAEIERLSKMTSEEIINERLTMRANYILSELESDSDLYRVFNTILREKKLKKLNGND